MIMTTQQPALTRLSPRTGYPRRGGDLEIVPARPTPERVDAVVAPAEARR